jgi:molybdopterin molybdotransferase
MDELSLHAAFVQLSAALAPAAHAVRGVEDVALLDARGRVLAQPLIAGLDLPGQDLAAMDGYAVRSADLAAGARVLPVAAHVLAGHPAESALGPGSCARIMTGAPLPAGSDAVVMMEVVEAVDAGHVLIPGPVAAGTNRRLRGEHVRAGAAVLAAGRRLRAADLALAAALGHARLPVLRRLRVGVLSTGDELRDPPLALAPGTAYDSNRPMLLAALAQHAFAATDLAICPDDPAALQERIHRAFAQQLDAVLVSGGAALGDADVVRSLGGVRFLPINVRPGRGLAIASLAHAGRHLLVLGLPGNAVAAYVLAHLLALPLLARLAGADAHPPQAIALPAARELQSRAGRIDFRRARLLRDDLGNCRVDPLPDQGSAMIRSVCEAQAIVAVGPQARTGAGELLPTYLLSAFESPDPY